MIIHEVMIIHEMMFIDEVMFRLYKSLGEYDVVNAILSKHVTTQ